jgi:toxin ParE1/3/4
VSGYVINPRAERDLEEISDFTAWRWSEAQADKYQDELFAAFQRLADAPALGRDCSDVRFGYRRYNVKSHVIFYRFDDHIVEIMRVLHKSRDFPRHL